MTYQQLELESWPRKEHFNFFKDFTHPYFNVCVTLNMASLHTKCRTNNVSFSAAYLFALAQAIEAIPEMRYRLVEGKPVCYEKVELSVVSLAADNTFRFVTIPMETEFTTFQAQLSVLKEIAHQENLFSERVQKNEARADVCHVSILPWLNFTSFSHATTQGVSQGIPKCVFGKYDSATGMTPLSIDVHHALMDGLHVAKFIAELQKKLDEIQVNV